MQVGLGASIGTSIIEASPRSDMQRHEQVMQRQNNENDQELNDRQWQENQTHDQKIRQIEADVVVMFLNS